MELRFSIPHSTEKRGLEATPANNFVQTSAPKSAFQDAPQLHSVANADMFVRRPQARPVHFGVRNTDKALDAQLKLIQAMKIPYGVEVTILTPRAKPEKLVKPMGDKNSLRFIVTPEEAFPTLNLAQEVTVGDLNGSHHKLLEHLVMSGLVEMPEEKLKAFVDLSKELNILSQRIHHRDDRVSVLAGQFVNHHQKILALIPSMKWVGGSRQLRLIGDIVVDRGASDSLTLAMIEHLSKGRPQRFRITIGNHDHTLLYYLAANSLPLSRGEQKLSLTNVRHMMHVVPPPVLPRKPIETDFVSREDYVKAHAAYVEERDQIRNQHGKFRREGNTPESRFLEKGEAFLKRGEIISWNTATQTVFMHAPISRQLLKESVEVLRKKGVDILPYDEVNAENLNDFIRALNSAYREHVKDSVKTSAFLNYNDPDNKEKAFYDLVWHRGGLQTEDELPFTLETHGVRHIVHGHDDYSRWSPYSVHYYANTPDIPENDVPVYIINTDNHARSNNDIFWSGNIERLRNEHRVEPHSRLVASFIDVGAPPNPTTRGKTLKSKAKSSQDRD